MKNEDVKTDQETVETMVAGLLEFMHGKGQDGIVQQLQAAQDEESLAQAVGTLAYTLTHEAAQQADKAQKALDMDMLLGVATEVIDALVRMCQALKLPVNDVETFNEQALVFAMQAYLQTANPSDEEREAAMAMLQEMGANGMMDEGAAQLQALGQKVGVDPFAPQQTPMAQGVSQGLMGMQL